MSSSATGHFIAQRGSAVVLVVLCLWFAWSISNLDNLTHCAVVAFLVVPFNNILLMVLCTTLAYHAHLGVQVVIDDYVHAPRLCWFSHVISRAAHLAIALLMVYTVYDIGFGA